MKKTPIYERHVELGAKILDFHGWLMPIQYKGIVTEHLAVRNKVGIFDVSHMGEFEIKGQDAYDFVQILIANNLDKIEPGRALYTTMCNENGGIIDDLVVYMFNKEHLMLVVNASNTEKDFRWINAHVGSYKVEVNDISPNTVLLAVQGPKSALVVEKFLDKKLDSLKRFHFQGEEPILISRTGYTGEDGFELFIEAERGVWLWDELMKFNIQPVGLGARDTLRLEKGYILYGNDANESTTPLEAGIEWTVDLEKPDFIGKEALLNRKIKRKLVFLEMQEKGIPRPGCKIKNSEGTKEIGEVTSGTYSPSLEMGIALGYVDIGYKNVAVEIRGRLLKAEIGTVKSVNKLLPRINTDKH